MKLVCPKCMARLKVAADKIPAIGGWARCPKCSERFFVQPSGKKIDLLADVSKDSAAERRPLTRDSASQHLINRMKASKGKNSDNLAHGPLIYSEITIFPETIPSPLLYRGIGFAFLSLPVLLLVMAFLVRTETANEQNLEAIALKATFNDEKNINLIQSDLIITQRNMINKNRVISTINHTGSESRIFKYFAGQLTPGICSTISSLEIVSEQPIKGFEATGICSDGTTRRLKMLVTWTSKTAVVAFQGYPRYEEVEMFPLRAMAAKQKSN